MRTTSKTRTNSIRRLVRNAIGRYNRAEHNDCTGSVDFSWPQGGFTVRTKVAGGDGMPWARKPMDAYIYNALTRSGHVADFASERQYNGNVSMSFRAAIAKAEGK